MRSADTLTAVAAFNAPASVEDRCTASALPQQHSLEKHTHAFQIQGQNRLCAADTGLQVQSCNLTSVIVLSAATAGRAMTSSARPDAAAGTSNVVM
jgi:hypothetical protein